MLGPAAAVCALTFLVDHVFVEAEFIVAPSDTEAAVGDTATLYCSSSLGSCGWYHRPLGSHGHEIVFTGGYIYNGYRGRFQVTETNNACNLQIESISIEDAGLFTCIESSTEEANKTAELIVFEQFPSDTTCAAKITCAPICKELELSCGMKSYSNLHPIVECGDSSGKQWNSALSADKTRSTVRLLVGLRGFALQPDTFICQVKYPSKPLSSKYMWSFSTPVESTNRLDVALLVLCCISIIIASAIGIHLLFIRINQRKSKKRGNNSDTAGKTTVNDGNNRSSNEKNCHPDETPALLSNNDSKV